MGFTTCTATVNVISALADLPNLEDGLTAAQLKAKFDAAGAAIKQYINDVLIAELQKTDADDSGAGKIGVADIPGIAGNDVETCLKAIAALGAGSLPPDNSITNDKLFDDVKIGSKATLTTTNTATIVAAINEVKSDNTATVINLNNHTASTSLHLSIMTTQGDMIYRGASAPARLSKGASHQALGMNSAGDTPEWKPSLQSLMTALGDIVYASAANTPARLALGTALQVLRVNASANGIEWATPVKAASGTYSGNGTNSRQITVGFRPKFLLLIRTTSTLRYVLAVDDASNTHFVVGDGTSATLNNDDYLGAMHSNGFTTGDTTEMNANSNTYFWAAFA